MPDIQQTIRDWLHEQPDSSGGVSDTDVQNLVALLKTPEGQQVTSHRAFDGLAPTSSLATDLRLLDIGDISGIKNLGPQNPLSFGTGNLCVIYGHNGSGKSGYTRLLKKACGKPRAKELKPNVFQPPPAVCKCRISYQVAEAVRRVDWPANGAPVDELRAVDIFDADAAMVYLTEETAAAYTPPSVALFESLAVVCDRIKTHLQTEQERLVSMLPPIPTDYAGSIAGMAYGTLTRDPDATVLQSLVQWRDEDKYALDHLNERLKADDPAGLARTKRNTKLQIDQLASLLRNATTAFSDERISSMRALRADALTKRRIATESAKIDTAKLEGIGTDTWKALWEAAKAYSQLAYPGRDFPVIDNAVCILCHQGLGPDAQQRLREFDGFVRGKLEAEANTAEETYQQSLADLPTTLTNDEIRTRCEAAGLKEDVWVEHLGEIWDRVDKTRDTLLCGEVTGPATPVGLPISILDELTARSKALEREATQHDQDAATFDRAQAAKDKLDLEARRWTAHSVARLMPKSFGFSRKPTTRTGSVRRTLTGFPSRLEKLQNR